MNPSLLNKRGQIIQQTTKRFDKIFVVLFLLFSYTLPVIAGFDAVRYHWSNMPTGLNFFGGILLVLSFLLGIWAMIVNTNFEMTVFIKDEEQQVCKTGPYRFIRHPGYAAEIIALVGVVLLLGSWWGFIPVGTLALLFIVRTYLEDKTLQHELPGYKEYAKSTSYRLIPFIW
jgi:protein-S-isoprenylcysteine O-methyltransferase Ste14